MFTGHTAFALLARRARPTIPFAVLFVAAYAPDFAEIALRTRFGRGIDPVFWSHSWPAMGLQAFVLAALVMAVWRDWRGALVTVLAVASHWPADVLTGLDKPTWRGGPAYGFYLYEHHLADFLVEALLLLAAWWVTRVTWPRVQRLVIAAGVAGLVVMQGVFAMRAEEGKRPAPGKAGLFRAVVRVLEGR